MNFASEDKTSKSNLSLSLSLYLIKNYFQWSSYEHYIQELFVPINLIVRYNPWYQLSPIDDDVLEIVQYFLSTSSSKLSSPFSFFCFPLPFLYWFDVIYVWNGDDDDISNGIDGSFNCFSIAARIDKEEESSKISHSYTCNKSLNLVEMTLSRVLVLGLIFGVKLSLTKAYLLGWPWWWSFIVPCRFVVIVLIFVSEGGNISLGKKIAFSEQGNRVGKILKPFSLWPFFLFSFRLLP